MILKVLFIIGLVSSSCTAIRSVDTPVENSPSEDEDLGHSLPDLGDVIREVEQVQETFLRGLSEEMKKIDAKLQKIKERHDEELEKSRQGSEIRPPIKMTLEVSVPGREKEVKTFDLVSNGEDGKTKIYEVKSELPEKEDSDESEEMEEKRRGKELPQQLPEDRKPEEHFDVKEHPEDVLRENPEEELKKHHEELQPKDLTKEKETEPKEELREAKELIEEPTTSKMADFPSEPSTERINEVNELEEIRKPEKTVMEEPQHQHAHDENRQQHHKKHHEEMKTVSLDNISSSSEESKESSEEQRDLMTAPSGSNVVIHVPEEAKKDDKEVTIEVLPVEPKDTSALPKAEPKVEPKAEPKVEAKAEPKVETQESPMEQLVTNDDKELTDLLPPSNTNIIINLPSSKEEDQEIIIGIDIPADLSSGETGDGETKKELPGERREATTARPTTTSRRPETTKRPNRRPCPPGFLFNIATQDCGLASYGTGHLSYYWYMNQPKYSNKQNNPFMNMFGFAKQK